jgi:coenzyme F420-0:L-glutamate ligase / coenzyme F420-1:gamma-L-glutamate ligase
MDRLIDAIRNRRSIRKYTQDPIAPEIIKELLDLAAWAPSAHSAQPWRFIIITDSVQKQVFAQAMARVWFADLKKDGVSQEAQTVMAKTSVDRFVSAPVLIIACLTMEDMLRFPDIERQRCEHDLAVQSLSAAIQNLLLVAHAKGIGSCWYCAPIFCKPIVREMLKIPLNVEPQALITLGYPAEIRSTPLRIPVQRIAYLGKWGNAL